VDTNPYLCRLWHRRGQQPTVPAAGTNRRLTVFGSVEVFGRGRVEVLDAEPTSAGFARYLAVLDDRHAATGREIFLVVDNGSCHTSKASRTALAARGAHVLVVGRNEQRAKDVAAEIEGSGGSATFRLTTLSDLESARELVEWATEAGGGHVDILINNAGVAVLGPSSAATEAEFDESFAVNVKVPFFLVAALAPAMAERGWGSIVNVSTMVASFGQAGMALYGASRAALELLTKAWAAEYGPSGVRVNAVAPGPTRTRMMEAVPEEMVNQLAALAPAGRVAEPEELAAAIVFLASDDASFVHGVTLAVDGGRVAT